MGVPRNHVGERCMQSMVGSSSLVNVVGDGEAAMMHDGAGPCSSQGGGQTCECVVRDAVQKRLAFFARA